MAFYPGASGRLEHCEEFYTKLRVLPRCEWTVGPIRFPKSLGNRFTQVRVDGWKRCLSPAVRYTFYPGASGRLVIMPDILKMALEHQKGRGIDEYAQGHNFTERWFRDSGLYECVYSLHLAVS